MTPAVATDPVDRGAWLSSRATTIPTTMLPASGTSRGAATMTTNRAPASASAPPALASASAPAVTKERGHAQKAVEHAAAFFAYARRNGLKLTCSRRFERVLAVPARQSRNLSLALSVLTRG